MSISAKNKKGIIFFIVNLSFTDKGLPIGLGFLFDKLYNNFTPHTIFQSDVTFLKRTSKPMTNTITQEHILLYIYGEADSNLKQQIAAVLQNDMELYQFYQDALDVKNLLEQQSMMVPAPTSERIIMEESHDSYSETV